MGIFNKSKSKDTDMEDVDLLKVLSSVTPEDIDKLLDIVRHSKDIREYDPNMVKYLSLVNQVFGGTDYLSIGDTVETRQQRYEIYDEMDESTAYISSALDILSDDATQADENGVILTIISENSKVKNAVEELFNDLDIESKLGKWARAIAKYGDLFIQVNSEEGKGVLSVNDTIYPSNVERRDLEGKLLAFCDSYDTMTTNGIYAPWEFIHFRLKGDLHRSQKGLNISGLDNNSKRYALTSSYGQSILRPAIKVYAQLRFVENILILSRLTNSIRRNIFMINTGDTDPTKAYETILNYANLLKKDISLDVENGVYNAQKHTVTYDEDIFLPVNDTKNDVRIESIGGDVNISEQYDVEYLLNKLFAALKIPKAYLNYEQDLNARSTLIQLDIRYARSVNQLQIALCGGLLRLAKIHLAYLGINPDYVDLDIRLTTVSSIDREARLEQQKVSIESARTMWDMIVTMNDKLTESKSSPNPLGSMFGEDGDGEVSTESNTALDLEYVTEHILTSYFNLGSDDIDKILRRETKKKEESKSVTLLDNKHYPNSDLREMYPIGDMVSQYQSIRESLLDIEESNVEINIMN